MHENKGFYFSLEATLSIVLFACILLFVPFYQEQGDLTELYVLQKQNDLLKVWTRERKHDLGDMEKDFVFVFPGKSGVIELDGEKKEIGKPTGERVYIAKGLYFSGGKTREIRLAVFD